MGAVLIDSILQAGLNYKTVVSPRVEYFVTQFPHIMSCTDFLNCLTKYGSEKVLRWTHIEKISRLIKLTKFFISKGIESVSKLSEWIRSSNARKELLGLHGIGNKTVDYIGMLVGLPTIPVDRHLRKFISAAGVELSQYEEYRKVAEFAADLIKMPRVEFDYAVWTYVSNGKLD